MKNSNFSVSIKFEDGEVDRRLSMLGIHTNSKLKREADLMLGEFLVERTSNGNELGFALKLCVYKTATEYNVVTVAQRRWEGLSCFCCFRYTDCSTYWPGRRWPSRGPAPLNLEKIFCDTIGEAVNTNGAPLTTVEMERILALHKRSIPQILPVAEASEVDPLVQMDKV